MRLKTPAKINLFLFITGLREDGYHLIYTLFQKIALFDELEVNEAGRPGIFLECPEWLDSGKNNLVYRAAEAFFNAADIAPSVAITLKKNIPAGGGLGGGSSDAAATLKVLNMLYGNPLSREQIHNLACSLGADCPFFLMDVPAAIGEGTGTELEAIETPERWFVLVLPDFGISTKWAYENFKLTTGHQDTIFDARAQMDALLWNNDLEQSVIKSWPDVTNIKDMLLEHGAETAVMTGSGSTVFGVFSSKKAAGKAAGKIDRSDSGLRAVATRSLRPGEPPGEAPLNKNIGASSSGKTRVFGTRIAGSNPAAPARQS